MGWVVGYGGTIAKMTGTPLGISNNNNEIPHEYILAQNYPNPFNPTTNINFALPKGGAVELKVFDILGSEVSVLANLYMEPGFHSIKFDASDLSSGLYFYTLKTGEFIQTKKMVLMK